MTNENISTQLPPASKKTQNTAMKMQLVFDDNKNTPLHFAAAAGTNDEVVKLLNNGHKIDPENYMGWTPLMMAARNGHYEVVRTLINHHADATKQNKYGMSVFLISISSGNKEIVQVILQHLLNGGVSKQSMEFQISPISIATLYQHNEIFDYLIEQSFNINVVSPTSGITPIMFAAAEESTEYFNALASKGADQHYKNKINQSAVDILQTKPNVVFQPPNPPVSSYSAPPPPPAPTHNPHILVTSPYQQQTFTFPELHIRKSSDVMSPSYVMLPNVSPISPMGYLSSQVFFSPSAPISPPVFNPATPTYHNSFLDLRLTPQHFIQSPISPAPVNWV